VVNNVLNVNPATLLQNQQEANSSARYKWYQCFVGKQHRFQLPDASALGGQLQNNN
jgi:hypothetical protein